MEISKEILSLYDLWKTFDMKKDSVTLLERMPKPKTASSRYFCFYFHNLGIKLAAGLKFDD